MTIETLDYQTKAQVWVGLLARLLVIAGVVLLLIGWALRDGAWITGIFGVGINTFLVGVLLLAIEDITSLFINNERDDDGRL